MPKKHLLFAIASFSLLASELVPPTWRAHEMDVRVRLNHPSDAQALARLQLKGDIYAAQLTAALYVTPDELRLIEALGFDYEIMIPDCRAEDEAQKTRAKSYDQLINAMNQLEKKYPALCKKYVFGKSVKGYECSALKITRNVAKREAKPQVLFDGGIHGDEVIGPELVIRFAQHLLQKEQDSQISSLLDNREVWCYVMVNPDGRVGNRRENGNAMDCNRDWSYMWASGGKKATGPASQPEIQAFRRCLLENQFAIQITYHAGTEALLYPWGYQKANSPDMAAHKALCNAYKGASGYKTLAISSSYASYPTYGETLDFSYGVNGTACLTMEASKGKALSETDIKNYYEKNLGAMLKMVECAGNGLAGTVVDAGTKQPVAAIIFPQGSQPCYASKEAGDFHKFVQAGTYALKVESNGYRTKSLNNVLAKDGAAEPITIELERDTEHQGFAFKVVSCEALSKGNPYAALGAPDQVEFTVNGSNGLILDMQLELKQGGFKVYSSGGSYTFFAAQTPEGPWKQLGTGSGSGQFNLAGSGLPSPSSALFCKILPNFSLSGL